MGCNCCKEVNHADYKKCQQDIDRILRNCKTTSSKQYLLLMASLLHLMQRLQCQKRRNVKIEDKAMTREEEKKLLPIIQAFAAGKQIQDSIDCVRWFDTDEINLEYEGQKIKHRVKSEPKYRPFKSQEECWEETHKHPDFGWLLDNVGEYVNLFIILSEGIYFTKGGGFDFSKALKGLRFTDCVPFGIKEE